MAWRRVGTREGVGEVGVCLDDALCGFLFEAELAAGGIHIMAFFDAEGGGDSGFFQEVLKGAAVGEGGAFPLESLDGIVGDEVDFCADGAGVAGEDFCLGEGVVDSLDEDVFEGEFLFFGGVPVGEGVHELGNGVFFIHRHDLGANFVGGSVEGDGEADLLGVTGEFTDLEGEAGGGDGEVAGAEVEGVSVLRDWVGSGVVAATCAGSVPADAPSPLLSLPQAARVATSVAVRMMPGADVRGRMSVSCRCGDG